MLLPRAPRPTENLKVTFLRPAKRRAGAQAREESEGRAGDRVGGDTSGSKQKTDSCKRDNRKGVSEWAKVRETNKGWCGTQGQATVGAVSTPMPRQHAVSRAVEE